MERVPCTRCGALILAATAKATGGLCMPCKHGTDGRYSFDEQEYWEERYSEFERRVLRNRVLWRAPAHRLRGTALFSVFERLCAEFPDHPDGHNTVFYLINEVGQTPTTYSVLLRCDHFEHTALDDIRTLAEFLAEASDTISSDKLAGIDVLNDYEEELQLRFYSPRDEIIAILQSCSSRIAEPCAPPTAGSAGAPPASVS